KLAGRVGISTYVEVFGTSVIDAEIEGMEVKRDGDVIVRVRNKGNIWVRPKLSYWVTRGKDKVYADSLDASLILPFSLREYRLKFKGLKIRKGDEVIARIDYGGEKILEGVKKIE
ncbi:MAG: hypothetical protein ABIN61_07470, partial [candidate division WOR-3 bacterium]